MSWVKYSFHITPDTTTTVCTAILLCGNNSFTLATEISACVDPTNFNKEDGEKYAKERAEVAAMNELWKLEGYKLFSDLFGVKV
jgi:hypothetical protein